MGTVYLAEELDLERKVAIKMISPKLSEAKLAMGRFEREARVMATVEHPHIVRVYAMGHSEDRTFLVLEYIEGESLSDYIERAGRVPVSDVSRILRQIIEGLAASWEKKIVHRDIKPSNILLDKNIDAHVTDFGLAKPIEMPGADTISADGVLVGTPYYISPEQALGKPVDCRADIYSLGIVLYEMLTGEKPFDGQTPFDIVNQHLTCPLPSIREKRPDVPLRFVELIEWMTQKKVNLRPQSYSDLLNAIDTLSQTRTPGVSGDRDNFAIGQAVASNHNWIDRFVAAVCCGVRSLDSFSAKNGKVSPDSSKTSADSNHCCYSFLRSGCG